MLAKLVHGHIDPNRLGAANAAVESDLAPAFAAHPGARQGYWMANPASGHVLVVTGWSDRDAMEAEQAADGRERARAAERLGLRIHAVETMDVVAAHEVDPSPDTVVHWVRATWVEGVDATASRLLGELHEQSVRDKAAGEGFCASYWLADRERGDGLALSMWSTPEHLQGSEHGSRRRRRRVERALGCHLAMIGTYRAIGVVVDAQHDGVHTPQVICLDGQEVPRVVAAAPRQRAS